MAHIKKLYKNIKRHLTRKKMCVLGVAFIIIIVFASIAIKTVNDHKRYNKTEYDHIITRFPMFDTGMLRGDAPKSAIFLSWYENTVTMKDGAQETLKLDAELYPIIIEDRTLEFISSDPAVAEIDSQGNIIVKNPGSVELTVKNDYTGNQAKAYLQIIQPVTGVFLDKSTVNLYTTDTGMRLEATLIPANASNTAVQWRSKDEEIVTVDQTGHLKPGKTGLTEIVITTEDGNYTAKCFVNVINEVIRAQSVEIVNKDDITLNTGETWTGLASVLPLNARNLNVGWSSSDTSVATVSQTGTVKAIKAGTAEITAKSTDGPSDSITITVTGGTAGPEIDINPSYNITGGIKYTAYAHSLDMMADMQMGAAPKYNDGSSIKAATREQVRMYLDPNEFGEGAYKYQFMDLSQYNGISRDVLASFLEGKGVLSGKADVFIEAAREYNISELYLVAHSCVETGYGTSQLANGVLINGTRVYNVYGIRATDTDTIATATAKAYELGWTSVDAAIKGGAKWISEMYINSPNGRQNTLYKMRWNPDNPGQHLYASDITWATAQAVLLEKLFAQLPGAQISYEIPVYAGSNAITISY
ncbi:MAG: Ig-like domain-containing protein [Oscillospiraceae bacterium]|nr:Ig-like domain-containing protein [Oscillospiraceae bacterium]